MTVDDVLQLKTVGSAVISPNGKWVAYVVTERDSEDNINFLGYGSPQLGVVKRRVSPTTRELTRHLTANERQQRRAE